MSKKQLMNWSFSLLFISLFLLIVDEFLIFKYAFLNFKNINLIISAVLIFILIVIAFINLKRKISRASIVFSSIYCSLLVVLLAMTIGYIGLFDNIFGRLRGSGYNEYKMSVVVLADSKYQEIAELKDLKVAVPSKDTKNVKDFINSLAIKGINFEHVDTKSYVESYNKLLNHEVEAFILNGSHEEFIKDKDAKYKSKIRKIYEITLKQAAESTAKYLNDGRVFNVYISGIDTEGSIDTVSRSDVNIIATVNMNTHKILLTTTPRDSYVSIPGEGLDEKDKLTHAGLYGVDTSVKTLEKLYGVDINYYAKVNFTTFINIIKLIGDISIYNDQAFTSLHGGYEFPVGNITMNAEQTLGFVRERYSLANGDFDRGKNQQKVLKAVLEKMIDPSNLKNYNDILDTIEYSTQTNMEAKTLMTIINEQLDHGVPYTIETQALEVFGVSGLESFLMPGQDLYMAEINEDSLIEVKNKIRKAMDLPILNNQEVKTNTNEGEGVEN